MEEFLSRPSFKEFLLRDMLSMLKKARFVTLEHPI